MVDTFGDFPIVDYQPSFYSTTACLSPEESHWHLTPIAQSWKFAPQDTNRAKSAHTSELFLCAQMRKEYIEIFASSYMITY